MYKKLLVFCFALILVVSLVLAGCSSTPSSTPTTPAASKLTTTATSTPTSPVSSTPTATQAPTSTASGQTFNLRYVTQWVENSAYFQTARAPILKEIEQKSNGRIKFTVFGGATLGAPADHYDIIRTGKADMGDSNTGYTPGRFNFSEIFTVPGAFSGAKTSQDLTDLVLAVSDAMIFKTDFTDTVPVSANQTQPFLIYTANKQVKTLEDLKALKLRHPGGLTSPTIAALGATPINMAMQDMYTSMQTGVIDGAVIGPSGVLTVKLQEVLKYTTRFNMGYAYQVFAVNKDTWAKLPPDLQQIIKDATRKAEIYEQTMFAIDDPTISNYLTNERKGISYTLPDAESARWITAIKPVVAKWQADVTAKNLPAEDLIKLVRTEAQKRNISFPY